MSNMKATARFVITDENKPLAAAFEHFLKELTLAAAENRAVDAFWNLAMAYRYLERFTFFVPDAVYERRYGADAVHHRRFYNIGGGHLWFHPTWTVIDANLLSPKAGIRFDLSQRTPLPVADNIAKLVYSSHCLDYLADEAVNHVLQEAIRILEPGTLIRIAVPDIDILYRAFARRENEFFSNIIDSPAQYQRLSVQQNFISRFIYPCSSLCGETPQFHLNDAEIDDLFARLPYEAALDACLGHFPGGVELSEHHKINWFNERKLSRLLAAAGFVDIVRSGCGQSQELVLCDLACFDYTAPESTLYMEARKPPADAVIPP
jgi:hypothetical protein